MAFGNEARLAYCVQELRALTQKHVVEETGELWCAAGLHRLRGQLLLKGTVPDFEAAEAEFLKAIDSAQGQSAKLWELRAAVSLAHLWRDQRRHAEARDLLAPIYGWFTEGFDLSDLKNATALLNELRIVALIFRRVPLPPARCSNSGIPRALTCGTFFNFLG